MNKTLMMQDEDIQELFSKTKALEKEIEHLKKMKRLAGCGFDNINMRLKQLEDFLIKQEK